MNKPYIGSDPELFVQTHDGIISSAIGKIGGSKSAPLPVPHGALQEDNVLLEFNTDPASSLDEFRSNLRMVMRSASDAISGHGLKIIEGISSHSYTDQELASFGDAAFVFGCDPDYNAWTFEENDRPFSLDAGLRTAGGHIHIGYSHIQQPREALNCMIVRACDYILGLPSVLMDKDDRRRELYGKCGALRHKAYGVEYRTLSNFWLFSDELIAWAYDGALEAYNQADSLDAYYDVLSGDEVQRIINENDKSAAKMALIALRNMGAKVYAA